MKVELLRGLERGNRNKKQAVRVTGILRVARLGYYKLPTGSRWLGSEMGKEKMLLTDNVVKVSDAILVSSSCRCISGCLVGRRRRVTTVGINTVSVASWAAVSLF